MAAPGGRVEGEGVALRVAVARRGAGAEVVGHHVLDLRALLEHEAGSHLVVPQGLTGLPPGHAVARVGGGILQRLPFRDAGLAWRLKRNVSEACFK